MAKELLDEFKAGDWQISADQLNIIVEQVRRKLLFTDSIDDGTGLFYSGRTKQGVYLLPLIRIDNKSGSNLSR